MGARRKLPGFGRNQWPLSVKVTAFAAATVISASAVFAQTYPDQLITKVVPFSAGGQTDTIGGLVAEKMPADLGLRMIVENVDSAGAGQVTGAKAEGYNILLHHIGMATSATLSRNLAYSPTEAFEYVGLVAEVPRTLVVRKDFAPTGMASFIAHVQESACMIIIRAGKAPVLG